MKLLLSGTLALLKAAYIAFFLTHLLLGSADAQVRETEVSAQLASTIHNAEAEYKLPDGRRVDIYDPENGIAWEVEWCAKWEESIGQSIGYAASLDMEPGVWLIFKDGDDEEWNQFQTAAEYLKSRGIPLHVRTHKL